MTATLSIAQQLAALPRLTVKQLQARYAEVFGEATAARNKTWLVRRIAWRIQANAEGGLSDRALARARELAAGAELRSSRPAPPAPVPATTMIVAPAATPADPRLPPPGSTLTRTYKGARLQVRVLANGFEHAGVVYPSLSADAKAITGSHCNGYLFFGLAKGAA